MIVNPAEQPVGAGAGAPRRGRDRGDTEPQHRFPRRKRRLLGVEPARPSSSNQRAVSPLPQKGPFAPQSHPGAASLAATALSATAAALLAWKRARHRDLD